MQLGAVVAETASRGPRNEWEFCSHEGLTYVFFVVADIVFSDGKVSSYLHVGNMVYTV